jgi:hypothetical protein
MFCLISIQSYELFILRSYITLIFISYHKKLKKNQCLYWNSVHLQMVLKIVGQHNTLVKNEDLENKKNIKLK